VVKLLLEDPRVDVNSRDEEGITPIYHAACEGSEAIVELLTRDPRVDLNAQRVSGSTPFFMACQNNHMQVVRHLLSLPRVDIARPMRDGQTPLSVCCEFNLIDIVKWMIASRKPFDPMHPINKEKSISMISIPEWIEFLQSIGHEEILPIDICQKKGYTELADLISRFHQDPDLTRLNVCLELGAPGPLSLIISPFLLKFKTPNPN